MTKPLLPTGICTDTLPDNGSKGFVCNNEKYFVVKKNRELFVYKNACPHIGIALEWQEDTFLDASKTMIQCANHGALFVIESGYCVSGPCSGKQLSQVPFKIIDNEIVLI